MFNSEKNNRCLLHSNFLAFCTDSHGHIWLTKPMLCVGVCVREQVNAATPMHNVSNCLCAFYHASDNKWVFFFSENRWNAISLSQTWHFHTLFAEKTNKPNNSNSHLAFIKIIFAAEIIRVFVFIFENSSIFLIKIAGKLQTIAYCVSVMKRDPSTIHHIHRKVEIDTLLRCWLSKSVPVTFRFILKCSKKIIDSFIRTDAMDL